MTFVELPFISRRSTVYGTHAMVCSSQPLATQAGIDILKKGGNAADAAVAIVFHRSIKAAALNVTEPGSTGLGGDAFCLFYDAKSRTVKGLNGSGRPENLLFPPWQSPSTPAALTLEHVLGSGVSGRNLPGDSVHAVTVPGTPAAWVDTVEQFGSGKLNLETILTPAIDLAENGFPVSHISATCWNAAAPRVRAANPKSTIHEWLVDNNRAPKEGEIMIIPTLAKTLRTLAKEGKKGFYSGAVASAIVDTLNARGSLMTKADFENHTSEFVEPISLDYHEWTVWEVPPNGQGITALIALGIIEALEKSRKVDFSKIKHNSAEYMHIVTESLRIAFADTMHYVADPNAVHVPTQQLLSKDYLKERAELINLDTRNNEIVKGYPEKNGNTVYFSVVDEEGNACSFINSISRNFGVSVNVQNEIECSIVEGTGVVLHNRGAGFSLNKDHPNCLGPNKRPFHTIIPSMITRKSEKGHELEACFGVMGAFMQPQGQVQVILNMKHYQSNPQHALDLPRLCVAPTDPPVESPPAALGMSDTNDSVVYIEDGVPNEIIEELRSKGHTCYVYSNHKRAYFGRGQIIRCHRDERTGHRVLAAGSDPRGDGCAIGW
ncbi:lincomycin-condensing protein lmbA [Mycotypha africana]|uniref:lincomycin-condensing protein lmbA n=1 Tax=Mycotypha africana TaxID=64632 RepID=UPI0023010C87|nr:lincomycin-condensing protein lmbA [Mycotypha africana]KAI8982383.1 lincomycin-condensing protein lmbA [Mycotypha africana]